MAQTLKFSLKVTLCRYRQNSFIAISLNTFVTSSSAETLNIIWGSNFALTITYLKNMGAISPTFLPDFFSRTSWEAFVANAVCGMANRFGKLLINLANFTSPNKGKVCGRMLVKLNGKFQVWWNRPLKAKKLGKRKLTNIRIAQMFTNVKCVALLQRMNV